MKRHATWSGSPLAAGRGFLGASFVAPAEQELRAAGATHAVYGVVFDTHLDTAEHIGGETLTYCAPVSRTLELE